MSTLPASPIPHMADYVSLPTRCREEVQLWVHLCERIDKAENKSFEVELIADEMSHSRGYSIPSINNHYYSWLHAGRDWRSLVNRAKLPKQVSRKAVEKAFKTYAENNQRSSKSGYRAMMLDFRNGKDVAGITWRDMWRQEHKNKSCPDSCPSGYTPKGWTYGNLQKTCGLTNYEQTATRKGRGAARDYLPPVYSTRVGLVCGQMYMFDDIWHDAKVNFLGHNSKAMRPLEFACIDVFSGCKVAYGLKPMLENDDGTRKTLTELEMRYLLAHVLCNLGYNEQTGTQMVVEHGTAAVRDPLRQSIRNWSQGNISFVDSGILSKPLHDGVFMGRPRGNFKVKAALESSHALAHTEAASLPGQMGMDRDHSPEELHGRDSYNNKLIKAYNELTKVDSERAKLFLFPFLNFYQYKDAIHELYEIINWRTWHNLEGYEEAGLVTSEFRLTEGQSDWLPMETLLVYDNAQQAAIEAVISRPGMTRSRKLAPQEVWNKGKDKLTRLPKFYIPEILGPKAALEKPVNDQGLFCFECRDLGPGEHRYYATVITPQGYQQSLTAGRKYMLHANPFDASEVFVTDPDSGAMLGIAQRWGAPCKADIDAIHQMMGKQAHHEKTLADPIRDRHVEQGAERHAMIEYNKQVASGDIQPSRNLALDAALPEEEPDDYDYFKEDENGEAEMSLSEIEAYLRD